MTFISPKMLAATEIAYDAMKRENAGQNTLDAVTGSAADVLVKGSLVKGAAMLIGQTALAPAAFALQATIATGHVADYTRGKLPKTMIGKPIIDGALRGLGAPRRLINGGIDTTQAGIKFLWKKAHHVRPSRMYCIDKSKTKEPKAPVSPDTALQFPSKKDLKSCLQKHPLTKDAYFTDKKINQTVARTFAHSAKTSKAVDTDVMLSMYDINAKLGLSPSRASILSLSVSTALKDCATGGQPAVPAPSPLIKQQTQIVGYLQNKNPLPSGISKEVVQEVDTLKNIFDDFSSVQQGFECLGAVAARLGFPPLTTVVTGMTTLAAAYTSYTALSTGGLFAAGKILPALGHIGVIAGAVMCIASLFGDDSDADDEAMRQVISILHHLLTDMKTLHDQMDHLGLKIKQVDQKLLHVQGLITHTIHLISRESTAIQQLMNLHLSTNLRALESLAQQNQYALKELNFRPLEALLYDIKNPIVTPSFDTLLKQSNTLAFWMLQPATRQFLVGSFWARCSDPAQVASVVQERTSPWEGKGAWALGYLAHILANHPSPGTPSLGDADLDSMVNIDFLLSLLEVYRNTIATLLQHHKLHEDPATIPTLIKTISEIRGNLEATQRALDFVKQPLIYETIVHELIKNVRVATETIQLASMVKQKELDEALHIKRSNALIEDIKAFSEPLSEYSNDYSDRSHPPCCTTYHPPSLKFMYVSRAELKARLSEQEVKARALIQSNPLKTSEPFTSPLSFLLTHFEHNPSLVRDWILVPSSKQCRPTLLPKIASDLGAIDHFPLFMLAEHLGLGEIISRLNPGKLPVGDKRADYDDDGTFVLRSGDLNICVDIFFKMGEEMIPLATLDYLLPQSSTPQGALSKFRNSRYGEDALLPVLKGEYDSIAGAQWSRSISHGEYLHKICWNEEGPVSPALKEAVTLLRTNIGERGALSFGAFWNPDGLGICAYDRSPHRKMTQATIKAPSSFITQLTTTSLEVLVDARKAHFTPHLTLKAKDALETTDLARARLTAWCIAMGIDTPSCHQDKLWDDSVEADQSPHKSTLIRQYEDALFEADGVTVKNLFALPRKGTLLEDKLTRALTLLGVLETSLQAAALSAPVPTKTVAVISHTGPLEAKIDQLQSTILQMQQQMSAMQAMMSSLIGRTQATP